MTYCNNLKVQRVLLQFKLWKGGLWPKSLINFSYVVWTFWQSLIPSLYGKLCFHSCFNKKAIKINWLLQLVWLPWSYSSIPLDDTNCKSCFQVYMKWNCSFMEAICWLMSHESWLQLEMKVHGISYAVATSLLSIINCHEHLTIE